MENKNYFKAIEGYAPPYVHHPDLVKNPYWFTQSVFEWDDSNVKSYTKRFPELCVDPEKYLMMKVSKFNVLPIGWAKVKIEQKSIYFDHLKQSDHWFRMENMKEKEANLGIEGTFRRPQDKSEICRSIRGWRQLIDMRRTGTNTFRLFYWHLSSGCYQWQHPLLLKEDLFDLSGCSRNPLPNNWVVRFIRRESGKGGVVPVFANTRTRQTTFNDPRITLYKQMLLNTLLRRNDQILMHTIFANTDNMINTGISNLAAATVSQLHSYSLIAKFNDEPGIGDGIRKQLFSRLAQEFFKPSLGLFRINHDRAEINEVGFSILDSLKYYYIFGRFLGLAIWQKAPIGQKLGYEILYSLKGCEITTQLFDRINAKLPAIERDALYQAWDKQRELINKFANEFSESSREAARRAGAQWRPSEELMKEEIMNNIDYMMVICSNEHTVNVQRTDDEVAMFTYSFTLAEDHVDVDELARENKWSEAIDALVENHRLRTQFMVKDRFYPATQAIRNGFKDVIPLQWLSLFGIEELSLLISGETHIDRDEWRSQVVIVFGRSEEPMSEEQQSQFTNQFWSSLYTRFDANPSELLNFIFLTTGMRCKPPNGWSSLRPKFTIRFKKDAEYLFQFATCSNMASFNLDSYEGDMDRWIQYIFEQMEGMEINNDL